MSDSASSEPSVASAPIAVSSMGASSASPSIGRFREFSDDAELLAQDWDKAPKSSLPWVMDPAMRLEKGVEGGFWLVAPPYRGYAKPRSADAVDTAVRPVAALEKIAADLAYALRLPVPPVTLFERTDAPAGEPKYHSISAVPFRSVAKWEQVAAHPMGAFLVRSQGGPAMSAIRVFDTWVQNVDHFNHPGNMLVRVEPGTPHVIRLAFIDYAWSFLHQWRAHGYKTPFVAPMYDPRTLTDFATIGQAIAAVEGVQDSTIESIVNRIPDEFLTAADKKAIIEGLVWRRDNIRPLIKSGVPGVS